jgi:hypothetical protein
MQRGISTQEAVVDKERLNYVIPADLEEQLGIYCDRTGRTNSDVVRQLMVEWVEGDRRLAAPATDHPSGRRTNLELTNVLRAALEVKIADGSHGTNAAVIAALLRPFLAHRVAPGETVTVRVALPTLVYDGLFVFCEKWNWSVADGLRILAENPGAFERLTNYALTKKEA